MTDQAKREPAIPPPTLGLDLDGTLDENPLFFAGLTRVWPGKVYVITYRDDVERARRDVASHGVRCDEVILVRRFSQKAEEIARLGISVYVDDMDEMLLHVPAGVTVLKIRNEGNFDYDERKWLYSRETGYEI